MQQKFCNKMYNFILKELLSYAGTHYSTKHCLSTYQCSGGGGGLLVVLYDMGFKLCKQIETLLLYKAGKFLQARVAQIACKFGNK